MEELIRNFLAEIGENPDRPGLKKTPERVRETIKFLTKGYEEDPKALFKDSIFTEEYEEMILLKGIDIYSLCEHHLLPFFGKCHVAYIPKKKLVGLSKIAKLVEIYSRRLQVQERLTSQIAKTLKEELDPLGVGVVIEAQHLCMIMRGVEKQNSVAVTSTMLGGFRRPETRAEFMNLIK